jgi:8-oxo-dGTP pyrophosphatase MutT (NUDIX family)
MHKIYFNNRLLYIADHSSGIADAIIASDAASALEALHKEGINPVVLQSTDPDAAFARLKERFRIIQAAGGYVTGPEGKVLMIFRRGHWDLPKGKLDEGETLEACALREVEEETGVQGLRMVKKLLVTWHTYTEKQTDILKETHWYLLSTGDAGVLLPQQDEGIEECKWVDEKDLQPYLENTYGAIIDVVKAARRKEA